MMNLIKRRFMFGEDQAPEEETITTIESGIVFRGAKLWVLILAIFVASLGLNTNSTAVIIGAMLISPLMGPILGMGLSAGIHDFVLLKKAFKNYFVATLFSVATACIYFLITPFEEAQSELLARTSPTIYDVLIALCGGLAGIIALSSRSQRTGNVVPGVAIATALMPPLCTVGYGLATANWLYAAGALYLYLINTVFISLATYIGVEFIFKFQKRGELNNQKNRQFKYLLALVGIFVIIPSLIMTLRMVHESIFRQNAHRFCKEAIQFEGTHLIGSEVDYRTRTIRLILMGEAADSTDIKQLQSQLPTYHLNDVTIDVIQGARGISQETILSMVQNSKEVAKANAEILDEKNREIEELKDELRPYQNLEALAIQIYPELQVLFPQVTSLALSQGRQLCSEGKNNVRDTKVTIATYSAKGKISNADHTRMQQWLQQRLNIAELLLIRN